MKILSRKLTAIVMLAIFAVSAFAIGFVSMVYKPAIAESTGFTITNLEDIIDSPDDITWRLNRQNCYDTVTNASTGLYGQSRILYSSSRKNPINTLNQYNTTADIVVNWGLFTNKGTEEDKKMFTYSYGGTTTKEHQYNVNKYDGNLSFFSTDSVEQVVWFNNTSGELGKNAVISFRTNFEREIRLLMRGKETTPYINGKTFGQYTILLTDTDAKIYKGDSSTSGNTALASYSISGVKTGDELAITYGAYDVYDTDGKTAIGTNIYLDIYNNTTKASIVNEQVYEGALDDSTNTAFYMGIYLQKQNWSTKNAISIGGVNEPLIFEDNKDINLQVESSQVKTLEDVTLPTGYNFVSSLQTVVDGTKSYDAKYTTEYYGVKKEINCKVTVICKTNIEDTINSTADMLYTTSTEFDIQEANQLYMQEHSWGTGVYGKYITKGDGSTTTVTYPKGAADGYFYGDYERIFSDDGKTITSTVPYNANDYDGNISVFSSMRANDSASVDFNANGKNSIISFRTNFETNRRMIMYARTEARNTNMIRSNTNSYYVYFDYKSFGFYFDNSSFLTVSYSDLLTKAQLINPNAGLTSLFTNGESIIITYGVYDTYNELNEVNGTYMYLHILNSNGYVIVDETVDVTDKEKTVNEPRAQNYIGLQTNLAGGTYYQGSILPVTIAGVNQPLLGYDYAIAEELSADNVGKSVSTLTLKEGYTIADATQVLTVGENKVKVNYTGEYYGSTKTVSAIVTVNVKANNVTIKDMAGADIQTAQVGSSFTLPTLDRAKMFVAYKAQDGKLYKQGETVEVSSDCSFTLTEVDVSVLEKIEIRLSTVDNRFGGLRFTAKILTADLDKLAESEMTVKSLIVPAGIEDFSGAQELVNTFEDGDYTYAYFTVTNLNYYNFNRQFTGSLIIDVPYESGNDYAVSNVVSGSAYDIASELLAQNVEARANGQALFNGTAEEIISSYAYGVIDLTYIENTLSYSNTLSNAWFELNGVENESVEDGVYSATVKVNVLEGANGFITDDNYSAPVIVRVGDGYKVAVVSARTLESGVLSLNIQVKIA